MHQPATCVTAVTLPCAWRLDDAFTVISRETWRALPYSREPFRWPQCEEEELFQPYQYLCENNPVLRIVWLPGSEPFTDLVEQHEVLRAVSWFPFENVMNAPFLVDIAEETLHPFDWKWYTTGWSARRWATYDSNDAPLDRERIHSVYRQWPRNHIDVNVDLRDARLAVFATFVRKVIEEHAETGVYGWMWHALHKEYADDDDNEAPLPVFDSYVYLWCARMWSMFPAAREVHVRTASSPLSPLSLRMAEAYPHPAIRSLCMMHDAPETASLVALHERVMHLCPRVYHDITTKWWGIERLAPRGSATFELVHRNRVKTDNARIGRAFDSYGPRRDRNRRSHLAGPEVEPFVRVECVSLRREYDVRHLRASDAEVFLADGMPTVECPLCTEPYRRLYEDLADSDRLKAL